MVLRVLLPPEEDTFEDYLHEGSVENEGSRCQSPHLNNFDGLGILRDERQGDKPSSPVSELRGGPAVGFGRTHDRKKE